MPRSTPSDRAQKLIQTAAGVFVEFGFQRAQMDDVADRLGVSKGTVYRSIESKESLLAAVLTHGDDPNLLRSSGMIEPVPLQDLAASIRVQLAAEIGELRLAHLAAPSIPADTTTQSLAAEITRMASGLFAVMARHRVRIMVLDRCAAEVPELAAWFDDGRYAVIDLWEAYLDQIRESVDPGIDRAVLARTVVELIALWAVKMPWDPSPRPYPVDTGETCAAMVANIVLGGHT